MKREAAETARRLRRVEGMAMKRIAAELGVSLSSVSRWTRDIELSGEQRRALELANPRYNAQLRGRVGRSRSARALRLAAQEDGRRRAQTGNGLHAQGCMLYWAEGSKSRNVAALTNSDSDLMALFVTFLRRCYDVPDHKMALAVNCHVDNGLTVDEIQEWWLERLALPRSCLRAPTVNRVSSASGRRRGNVLPYGTARVCAYSVLVVQSIYGAIQAYADIDRPEWLD